MAGEGLRRLYPLLRGDHESVGTTEVIQMAQSEPWVLGISNSHNGAVCLLQGDRIVAAVQEERLTRKKRSVTHGAYPSLALNYCLGYAGIQPRDLSLIVNCSTGRVTSQIDDVTLNPLLQATKNKIPVLTVGHHLAHAMSAFAVSGFESSAVLVVDGVGSSQEDLTADERAVIKRQVPEGAETISLYAASGTRLVPLEKHMVEKARWLIYEFLRMPRFRSLGGIFAAAAWQIFANVHEAGKVMGLAPYGRPTLPTSDFFALVDGSFEFSDAVPERFDYTDRWPRRQKEYEDLAASAQAALEDALLYLIDHLRDLCPSEKLCYAGGVALNSVANERILRERGFKDVKDVYIAPAAEDSGVAIGAAYYGLWQLTGRNTCRPLGHDAVGRPYSAAEVSQAIAKTPHIEVEEPDDVISRTVDLLAEGKIVGWFQGRSELGPRALGQRSILCDPRSPDAKALLNGRVKHREAFRPFAPVVPLTLAKDWFDLDGFSAESPYMLRVIRFRDGKAEQVPGVVHVDGTGRLQTVTPEANGRFYELVQRFYEKTGVPVILNTSFNVMGEPIVETPEDALWCFLSTGIDACVLEDKLVFKSPEHGSILDFYPSILASRYTESRLIIDGRLDDEEARQTSFLTFTVNTPWGRTKQVMSANVLPVLALIDGRRNGWSLLESLPKQVKKLDESFLLRALELWRKASQGEVMIDGLGPSIAVVDMLHSQRISGYGEATLTRMLVNLRRSSVIALRQEPSVGA
ncbi:MAG: carbamoyltransferase [Acidobacteria bacterium]|nr:MAG: carbamoyltransferase [Acidobacteriota bacterium]